MLSWLQSDISRGASASSPNSTLSSNMAAAARICRSAAFAFLKSEKTGKSGSSGKDCKSPICKACQAQGLTCCCLYGSTSMAPPPKPVMMLPQQQLLRLPLPKGLASPLVETRKCRTGSRARRAALVAPFSWRSCCLRTSCHVMQCHAAA